MTNSSGVPRSTRIKVKPGRRRKAWKWLSENHRSASTRRRHFNARTNLRPRKVHGMYRVYGTRSSLLIRRQSGGRVSRVGAAIGAARPTFRSHFVREHRVHSRSLILAFMRTHNNLMISRMIVLPGDSTCFLDVVSFLICVQVMS